MDSAKIATRTALKVAVIEVAMMDVVAVEVVLAEVDAVGMTATLVAFPSIHHPSFQQNSSVLT